MKTLINFVTHSLGDNIAFSIYGDAYQKKYGGQVYVKTKWYFLFYSDNPNVFFVDIDHKDTYDVVKDIYFIFREGPIQKIICDALGLDYEELMPLININNKYSFEKKRKYVCISVHSTCQMKYWNNAVGWRKAVRYLKKIGYDVYVIDRDEIYGIKEKWNEIPYDAINETGNHPIDYRIQQIKNCSFFIGLSSGLSWLAWALNKKVIMISGCTSEDNEFKKNCYRVINNNVCNSCLNDSSIDNLKGIGSHWIYCPRNKDFECTKTISFEMVKEKIDQCVLELNEYNIK
jgi:autotransporter strand-loop-strand O-heptosyltransferase